MAKPIPLILTLLAALCTSCAGQLAPTPTTTVAPAPAATPTVTQTPTATPLPANTPIPTPVPGGLYVDAALDLGPISPLSFGSNSGPWMTVPFELIPQFEESGLTLLRYPGGNWGDANNLLPYHIDSLLWQIEEIRAEPLMQVRLRGGTPERAVELMKTCAEKGLDVHYWSIGNEPNLFEGKVPGYDTVRYNKEWREFALAMKAEDPTIALVGPDINQYTGDPAVDPEDSSGRDWMREFLRANGDLVDVVAIHRYPFPTGVGEGGTPVDKLFADAEGWGEIIRNLRAAVREETGRDLPVAVTEFNSYWSKSVGGDTTPDSFYSAIWLAEVLGQMIREGTDIIAQFAVQTGSGGGGHGLMGSYELRPSYYVYQMYKRLGPELIYASSDRPRLSIYAAQQPDGALTLLVVNMNLDPVTPSLRLDHFSPSDQAEVRLLDETHAAELVEPVAASESMEYAFPATSVTVLTIPGQTAPID